MHTTNAKPQNQNLFLETFSGKRIAHGFQQKIPGKAPVCEQATMLGPTVSKQDSNPGLLGHRLTESYVFRNKTHFLQLINNVFRFVHSGAVNGGQLCPGVGRVASGFVPGAVEGLQRRVGRRLVPLTQAELRDLDPGYEAAVSRNRRFRQVSPVSWK